MKSRKDSGITLIALIITVIVMLILAGVSLNAIIGDNGIITNAQTANMKSGMVALEEWLQEKYVEFYDEADNYSSKPLLLNAKIKNLLLPDGTRDYVLNDGKIYYLINKSSLPEEISKQLIGGDTKEYGKYIRLQDVYGVTEDLKVYYCDDKGNNTYGEMVVANIDPKTPINQLNSNNGLKSIVTKALADIGITVDPVTGVTIGDVENLDKLEIDGNKVTITSLVGLSELRALKTLTLSNLGSSTLYFSDLEGLESLSNLYYLYLKNCYIDDYSNLESTWGLQYLYIYIPPEMAEIDANAQVVNLGNGLSKADKLTKLVNFGISGATKYFEDSSSDKANNASSNISQLSDISPLSKISNTIREKVQYLWLNENNFSSITSLSGFSGLVQVHLGHNPSLTSLKGLESKTTLDYLKCFNCNLTNLEGLENNSVSNIMAHGNNNMISLEGIQGCKKLDYLYVALCNLKDISAIENLTSLKWLMLHNNPNLEQITSLGTLSELVYLNINGNEKLIDSQVKSALADSGVAANCGSNFFIAGKYAKYFTSVSPEIDLSYSYLGYYLTGESSEFVNIKNRTNIIRLNLSDQKNLTDNDLQTTLSTMTGLQALSLKGCSNLTSINFIGAGKVTLLQELDLRGTSNSLTDLSNLEQYGTKLVTLLLNNSKTKMENIQNTINRVCYHGWADQSWNYIYSNYGTAGWQSRGLRLFGNLSEYDFSKCTSITYFATVDFVSNWECTGTLDLTKCSSLKYVKFQYFPRRSVLPDSVEEVCCLGDGISAVDASRCTNLHTVTFMECYDSGPSGFFTNNNMSSIKSITLSRHGGEDLSFMVGKTLGSLETLSVTGDSMNSHIKCLGKINEDGSITNIVTPNLKTLNLTYCGFLTDISAVSNFSNLTKMNIYSCSNLVNLPNLSNLTKLKSLFINGTSIADISNISGLTSLEYLDLSGNKISNISALSNLINVKDCTDDSGSQWGIFALGNNPIADLSPLLRLIDSNGKVKFKQLHVPNCNIIASTSSGVNNIDVIKQLHDAGVTNLYITGNTAITDTSKTECQVYIQELKDIFSNPGDSLVYE